MSDIVPRLARPAGRGESPRPEKLLQMGVGLNAEQRMSSLRMRFREDALQIWEPIFGIEVLRDLAFDHQQRAYGVFFKRVKSVFLILTGSG